MKLYPRKALIFSIFLVQLPIQQVNSDDDVPASANYRPSWMYKCVPKLGCQRIARSKFVNQRSGHYKNLNICRLLCSPIGMVWPIPSNGTYGLETRQIHPDLIRFNLTLVPTNVKALLVKMLRVAMRSLHEECRGNMTVYSSYSVTFDILIKTNISSPFWNIDESYSLSVQSHDPQIKVEVLAGTIFGARHAMETFVQLVAADVPEINDNYICSLHLLVGTKITDAPAYTHRGLMLDTARHFIPLENIKKMIEGMGATKMNVFHWHVTDSQSFPLESYSLPQFTKFGAYSPTEIYTTDEVTALFDFALVYGVRIIIEIDTPAHNANGWQWGTQEQYGNLAVCINAIPWRDNCFRPPCGQLNPVNLNTYKVLKQLYQDILFFLPSPPLLHVGGSEVNLNCWNNTRQIKTYLVKKGWTLSNANFLNLWAEFHNKSLQAWDEVVGNTETPVIIWSSSLTTPAELKKSNHSYLDRNRFVIQVKHKDMFEPMLKMGYRIVVSPGIWELNRLFRWTNMYSVVLPSDNKTLGGEATIWTEHIYAMGLDAYVWPRAAAVAERLWSNPKTAANVAEPRLQMVRKRLINRGLRPGVLSPEWCTTNDGRCKGIYYL